MDHSRQGCKTVGPIKHCPGKAYRGLGRKKNPQQYSTEASVLGNSWWQAMYLTKLQDTYNGCIVYHGSPGLLSREGGDGQKAKFARTELESSQKKRTPHLRDTRSPARGKGKERAVMQMPSRTGMAEDQSKMHGRSEGWDLRVKKRVDFGARGCSKGREEKKRYNGSPNTVSVQQETPGEMI